MPSQDTSLLSAIFPIMTFTSDGLFRFRSIQFFNSYHEITGIQLVLVLELIISIPSSHTHDPPHYKTTNLILFHDFIINTSCQIQTIQLLLNT